MLETSKSSTLRSHPRSRVHTEYLRTIYITLNVYTNMYPDVETSCAFLFFTLDTFRLEVSRDNHTILCLEKKDWRRITGDSENLQISSGPTLSITKYEY